MKSEEPEEPQVPKLHVDLPLFQSSHKLACRPPRAWGPRFSLLTISGLHQKACTPHLDSLETAIGLPDLLSLFLPHICRWLGNLSFPLTWMCPQEIFRSCRVEFVSFIAHCSREPSASAWGKAPDRTVGQQVFHQTF